MAELVRTMRLKVKREAYPWLEEAAREVNFVWNWANETSEKAVRRYSGVAVWLSGYDLSALTAGASACFQKIGADTVQKVCAEYAKKRWQARMVKLAWRKSGGSRKSLGWVPFKRLNLKRKRSGLRYAGKFFRVFEAARLEGIAWKDGCFASDAMGDWWLCLTVAVESTDTPAHRAEVGIDLGLKTIATTSDGDVLEAGRWTQSLATKLASAQRRGHKKLAKAIHRKITNRRRDALHKFSRSIVNQYQNIAIGDVSSSALKKTGMGKSVSDSGWGMLKAQLQYKGQQAGRRVEVVDERYTTRTCSGCGALTGPAGRTGLVVRRWVCADCGESHDRDVNAARNILTAGLRYQASVRGNELSHNASGATA